MQSLMFTANKFEVAQTSVHSPQGKQAPWLIVQNEYELEVSALVEVVLL